MLSAADILAGDPVPPPPDTRAVNTTSQSAANAIFAEFTADSLAPFGGEIVSRFNDYIARMSRAADFTGHSGSIHLQNYRSTIIALVNVRTSA